MCNPRRLPLLALALAALLLPPFASHAAAKELYFSGNTAYSYSNGQATLSAAMVRNDRRGGQSGSLRMILWATKTKYQGGTITGWEIATADLDPLKGGYHFSDLRRTVPLVPPPAGSYWMTLTLSEYNNGYRVMDYVNYSRKETFGGGPVAAPAPSGKRLAFIGPSSYNAKGNALSLFCTKITNNAAYLSGPLLLRVWATKKPYNGGRINGFVLAQVQPANLKSNHAYNNYSQNLYCTVPPRGSYYVTLTLEEDQGNGWEIADYVKMGGKYTSN